jgi:gluconate 2-dehydrogenase gamma chain
MSDRREALKIIGAIGTTCAFPFSAGELYGQQANQTAPSAHPGFFSPEEFSTVSKIADIIIPETDTPGAVGAGVPAYLDYVVSRSPRFQKVYRSGLRWLEQEAKKRYGDRFVALSEEQQIALLTPLAEAVDRKPLKPARRRGVAPIQSGNVGEDFFRAVKSMTADGYYTSKIGLVDELGYQGNTVLAEFPECYEH